MLWRYTINFYRNGKVSSKDMCAKWRYNANEWTNKRTEEIRNAMAETQKIIMFVCHKWIIIVVNSLLYIFFYSAVICAFVSDRQRFFVLLFAFVYSFQVCVGENCRHCRIFELTTLNLCVRAHSPLFNLRICNQIKSILSIHTILDQLFQFSSLFYRLIYSSNY